MTIRLSAEGFNSLLTAAQLRWIDVIVGVSSSVDEFVTADDSEFSIHDLISDLESEVKESLQDFSFTFINVNHPSPTFPIGIRIVGRFPEFSLPYCEGFDYGDIMNQIMQPLVEVSIDDEPTNEELNAAGQEVHQNGLLYNAMLVAANFNSENELDTGDWLALEVTQIDEEGKAHSKLLVMAESEQGEQFTATLMYEPWHAGSDSFETPDWWTFEPTSRIELQTSLANERVEFSLTDSEGQLTFQASRSNFQDLEHFLVSHGWQHNMADRTAPVSPQTLNPPVFNSTKTTSQLSTQQAGARTFDGIIEGPVDASGLLAIRGILNGDLNVPVGADVNVQGIVNGTINVRGGTVRLFGTADRVTLRGGRLEVYGIVLNGIERFHGDVYIDPGSIVGTNQSSGW